MFHCHRWQMESSCWPLDLYNLEFRAHRKCRHHRRRCCKLLRSPQIDLQDRYSLQEHSTSLTDQTYKPRDLCNLSSCSNHTTQCPSSLLWAQSCMRMATNIPPPNSSRRHLSLQGCRPGWKDRCNLQFRIHRKCHRHLHRSSTHHHNRSHKRGIHSFHR